MNRRKLLFGALLLTCATTPGAAQSWNQLAPTGGPPSGRYEPSGVYDAATNQMIIFGGGVFGVDTNDVWTLSLGASPQWTLVSPAGTLPPPRVGQKTVYDSTNSRMIVFGGGLGNTSPCGNDVWVLSNANSLGGTPTWTQLSPSGSFPAGRFESSAIYDAASNTMTIFGGNDCFSGFYNDVWLLSNANGLGGSPAWTQLAPAGTPPDPSGYHSAVYDPGSNRMVVFGVASAGSRSNEAWVLTNANGLGGTPTWMQLFPAGGTIPTRLNHAAVYDPLSNRMTIFGGSDVSEFNDVWVLANANGLGGIPTWTQLSPTGVLPTVREGLAAVYDPATNRMTIFGGVTNPLTYHNDAWVLDCANGVSCQPQYQFTGFLSPLTNGVLNEARAGRTVPIKWQLQDFSGNFVTALTAVTGTTSANLVCGTETTGTEVPTDTSGMSGLHYDFTSNQFIYAWQTDQSWTGSCRRFFLSLHDGSTHTVDFKLH